MTTLPLFANDSRCSAIAGRVMYLHKRSSFLRCCALQATPACSEKPDCLVTSWFLSVLLFVVMVCRVNVFRRGRPVRHWDQTLTGN